MTRTYPWQGKAEKLDDYDLPRIGHEIGVGEDVVHMVLDVESRGKGFDEQGVIRLFEEHVFYRNLPKSLQNEAVTRGLAWPKWRKNYKNNYTRFLKAYDFDPMAAMKACSWGLGQILGENAKSLGFETTQSMIEHFAESEANQLEGMIAFIKVNHLDDELRDMEKTTDRNALLTLASAFARVYNGRGYRKNNYHIRLVNRLEFWRDKPDTPWTPNMAEEEDKNAEGLSRLPMPKVKPKKDPKNDKPLTKSRTVGGAVATGAGTAGTAVSDMAGQIEPLIHISPYIKVTFVALTLIGIAVVFYARWDDAGRPKLKELFG